MLTALVHCRSGPQALTATLAALVQGVAEGVIADAVVICRDPEADIALIAEATGAELAEPGDATNPWREGSIMARRDWLFCLEAGDVPLEGWIGEIDRFTALAGMDTQMIGRLQRRHADWRSWLSASLAAYSPRPRAGDIVHKTILAPGAATASKPRISRLQARLIRPALPPAHPGPASLSPA